MVAAGKRALARLAVVAALIGVPVAAAGCGAGTHLVGQAIVHKIANTIVTSKSGRKKIDKVFCLDNVYNAIKDIHRHHYVFGALTVEQAVKNCEAGFKKNAAP
jgi:hypothetical protein